ncbi:Uncharacterized protein TCM_012894 [Theobroma cacao]|uniref:Uncharacterized protein n=1 Tax=Theobroma cacao TaxID=3641 RepID=A0A061FVU5_THECC|nr:Uncharacterized protein TCM_012894 [Theobroma cacao]
MARTRFTSKVHYGDPGRAVLGKKKNWDDSIIKEREEDCFRETVREKSIPSTEMEGQGTLESESEEESCDHTNNHESSDESIEERFPRHEHQSLGREVDGNAIQGGLIDMTDFLPSTIQSVGGDKVNDITGLNDNNMDAATRVGDDDVNAAGGVGDDDVDDATAVGGDDVNVINQNDQSALGFGFGTFQHNNANIIAGRTFGVTRSIQNNFGIDGVLNTTCNGSSSRGVLDSTRNSSSSLRGIMDSLGTTLEIASSPWADISLEELQKMVGLMKDVLLCGCHIKCLDTCIAKAKEYVMTKVDKPNIEAKIKELDYFILCNHMSVSQVSLCVAKRDSQLYIKESNPQLNKKENDILQVLLVREKGHVVMSESRCAEVAKRKTGAVLKAFLGASMLGTPLSASAFGTPLGASMFGAPLGTFVLGKLLGASALRTPLDISVLGTPLGAFALGMPSGAFILGMPLGASTLGIPLGTFALKTP